MSGSSPDPSAATGDPVTFVAQNVDSFAVRAVQALRALPADMPPWALIGGVAVAVNLAGFHRATGDLDTVSLDAERTVSLLVTAGATRSRTGGVEVPAPGGGLVSLDVIDVSEGADDHGSFLAHRFALDTAVTRTLSVTVVTTELATVSIPVATPAAIVSMKLHAVADRRASRPEKRSGDLYDIVRLTVTCGPSAIAEELRTTAGPTLIASTRDRCVEYFITDVVRSLRSLRVDSRSNIAAIDRTDMDLVAQMADLL